MTAMDQRDYKYCISPWNLNILIRISLNKDVNLMISLNVADVLWLMILIPDVFLCLHLQMN